MSVVLIEGKINGCTPYSMFKLSYPREICIVLSDRAKPTLRFKNGFGKMLGYESIYPEECQYPTDGLNSTVDGVVSFFRDNLSNTVLDDTYTQSERSNPVYYNVEVISGMAGNDPSLTHISQVLYSTVYFSPDGDAHSYRAYLRRLNKCCRFFNVKLTGAVDFTFKEFYNYSFGPKDETV